VTTTAPGGHARLITLGDYAGTLGRDALAELSAARLVATIEPTPVEEVGRAGFVLGQEPAPGTQLRRNQMVILYVADHPDAVLAPPREDSPAPKRRRARPQDPSLFDETVGTEPQPQAVSPSDPSGHPRPASPVNPFPRRPRRTSPGQPGQAPATFPSDLDPRLAEDRQPSPFVQRPRMAPPADPERAHADDDSDLSGEPDCYLDAEPDFGDDEIADAEFEPDASETELLEPDQVSDAPVLDHYRPEGAQRPRRRRPQRRFRRQSGRQTIAALLSGMVMLYLAASLLGAHRATPSSPTVPARTVARTAPAPAPHTSTTPHAAPVRHPKHQAHPRPRPVGRRLAPHRRSPLPTSSPSAPIVSPAPPGTASTPPATSPAAAPSPTAGASTQPPAHHTARASPPSPPSPIGPIAPAPNQP
jgi:hypothetical protein